jgi:hypothetical protein
MATILILVSATHDAVKDNIPGLSQTYEASLFLQNL